MDATQSKTASQMTPAELKLKELELKKQIASEVNPSLKDIRTIRRRIENLSKKLLIQDIERTIKREKANNAALEMLNSETLINPENADHSSEPNIDLNDISTHLGKLEAKIQIRLENL